MAFIYVLNRHTIRFVDANGKVRRKSRTDLPVGHPHRVESLPQRPRYITRRQRRAFDAEVEALFRESEQD